MRAAEIYIGTTLRGPARGVGKGIYIMQCLLEDGRMHERKAAAEIGGATENRLVLCCLRDSLSRFRYACEVTVYTESTYIAAAVNNRWPENWQKKNWINSKGAGVKDAGLWRDILWHLEDTGHVLGAAAGRHEFSTWMRVNLPRLYAPRDRFGEVDEKALNPGNGWTGRQTGMMGYSGKQ